MAVLVLGATGATGRLLLRRLLDEGHAVVAPVRDPARLPSDLRNHPQLEVLLGGVLDWPDDQLRSVVARVSGTACCLGHRLTLRGVFGQPRRLVTDSIRRICAAVQTADHPAHRLVVMNTVGVAHRGVDPGVGCAETVLQGCCTQHCRRTLTMIRRRDSCVARLAHGSQRLSGA